MIKEFDIFKDNKNNCYQLRTKSNLITIEFEDAEKEEIFLKIVDFVKKETRLSLKKLRSRIKTKENEAKFIEVLEKLNEFELLPNELTYEFKVNQYLPNKKALNNVTLTIFGRDSLAEKLKYQAKKENFKEVKQYFYSDSLDLETIIKGSDFLIVDANEWAPYYIEIINQFALKYEKPWLYLPGPDGGALKIGPLFDGHETGCYNCLISRIKSNHKQSAFLEPYESYLRKNKRASKPDNIPNSDIIYNIISNIAILEILKYFDTWGLPTTWRALIDINIDTFNLTRHELLRKPYCEVCRPELEYAPSPWLESIIQNKS